MERIARGWKITAAIGTVVTVLSQTKPEEAISNIAAWAKLAGLSNLPAFLSTPSFDLWVTIAGIATVFVSLIMWRRQVVVRHVHHKEMVAETKAIASLDMVVTRAPKIAADRAALSAARAKAWLGPDFETLEDRVARQKVENAEIRRQAIITEAERNRAEGQRPTWIPLCDALRYLVYEAQWAEGQAGAKNRTDFDRRVSIEFLEHLARGDVEARGKLGWTADSRQRATESIGQDFWVTAFINPHGEIALAAPDTQGTAGSNGTSDTCYMGVIVRKQQVEAVWPARTSGSAELTQLAKFVEPQRAQIAKERADAGS